jgi:hypothetical protein
VGGLLRSREERESGSRSLGAAQYVDVIRVRHDQYLAARRPKRELQPAQQWVEAKGKEGRAQGVALAYAAARGEQFPPGESAQLPTLEEKVQKGVPIVQGVDPQVQDWDALCHLAHESPAVHLVEGIASVYLEIHPPRAEVKGLQDSEGRGRLYPTSWAAIGATRWWHLDRPPAELWVLPGCLAEPSDHTESVPSHVCACSEMEFVSTGASGSRAASLRQISVLSGSPTAQLDAELHDRPACVAADQPELAREVVPVGVCQSSAARWVDPRREELAREPRPVHASHVPSLAQLPIGDDLVEASEAEGDVQRRESGALEKGSTEQGDRCWRWRCVAAAPSRARSGCGTYSAVG